jgi:hypothetical protein
VNNDRLADVVTGAPQFFDTNDFGYAALFFGEGEPATGLQVVVTPIDPPIVIPPEGGTVRFRAEIVNRSNTPVDFDLWIELEAPSGATRTSRPRSLTLEAGATLALRGRQQIRGTAPPGIYTLRGLVGTFPVSNDSDTFTFVKQSGLE